MYNNGYMLEKLTKQREEIDNLIKSYQNTQTPVNNFINTGITSSNDMIEWRILNENEEVDNLYVKNKTLFVGDNLMILKGVDGKLEKWKITKIFPIDKKDQKINELTQKIEELERRLNDEHTKSYESINESYKSNANDDGYVEPKPKTIGKSISKQK